MNAEKNLSFIEYVKDDFMSDFDTFRTLRPYPSGMFNDAVHKGITRHLRKYDFLPTLSRTLTITVSEIHQTNVSRDGFGPR
jgi:hypothetical protein